MALQNQVQIKYNWLKGERDKKSELQDGLWI